MLFNHHIPFDENDTDSIIKACLAGNPRAEDALVNKYMGYAKDVVYIYAKNTLESQEMINDSFLKALAKLSTYKNTESFKAWFRKIIINTTRDYHKKNAQNKPVVFIDNYEMVNIDNDIISKLSTDELLVLVNQLTPAYERAFKMNVIEGFTHKEIAEEMGITIGTSKSNLNDARIKLQIMVKENYPSLYLAQTINKKYSNDN